MRLTLLAAGGMLAITLATAAKAQPEHVWAEGFVPNLATQTELASATPEPRRESRRLFCLSQATIASSFSCS